MATSAAAVMLKARRDVVSYFFAMHAVTAEDAVPFVPQRLAQRRQFEVLRRRGVVRAAPDGKYWIDVATYDADRNATRRRMTLVLGVALIVAAFAVLLGYRG